MVGTSRRSHTLKVQTILAPTFIVDIALPPEIQEANTVLLLAMLVTRPANMLADQNCRPKFGLFVPLLIIVYM